MPMNNTQNPANVLITGATSGIGRHAALSLARGGYNVFATGRKADGLASLSKEADGLRLCALPLDVTDAESVARARAEIDQRTKGHGIDVLINNAGYGQYGPVEWVSDKDVRAQFETNVFGLLSVTRTFVPPMRERRQGRVIMISSILGRMSLPSFGVYAASKFAVEALSESLRLELAMFGVHVVLIEPGYIRTQFMTTAKDKLSPYMEADSPYRAWLNRIRDLDAQFEFSAADPIHTSKAIAKAITARRPKARYVAPWPNWVTLTSFLLLPATLQDFVRRKMFRL